jgi:flagellar FliJ protein
MPRFHFRLQVLLDHRRRIEDECQRELAKSLRGRMILQDQLRQMRQTIVDAKRQLGQGLVGRVDLDAVGQFARYSGQSTQRAQQIVVKLAAGERQIAAARDRLLTATRNRKALELLEERQRRAWRQEQDRREAAALDELAVQGYARAMLAGVGD